MKQLDLRSLIAHLSDELRKALESSAALCVAKGHAEITAEHWLMALLQEPGNDTTQLLTSQNLCASIIIDELKSRLQTHSSGHKKTPALAYSLQALIQDAWLLASVNLQQSTITAYHLMLAFIDQEESHWTETPLQLELQKASKEALIGLAQKNKPDSAKQQQGATQSAIQKYCVDMTSSTAANSPPIIGRDREVRQVIDILSRRMQNNPILVGDAGVGKTAIVEGLAQSIRSGSVPENLQKTHIQRLDLGLLQAGASIKGEFENRLKDILNEVRQAEHPTVLFIDEAHTLIGAGGTAGQNDAANLLKPPLARGELIVIAATTWAEYKKYFEKDAALTRRFQPVVIKEPGDTLAVDMLRSLTPTLEKHHQVIVLDEAIIAAVKLSIRFLPERQLPDKAVTLLDSACSRVAMSRQAEPASLQQLIQQQKGIERKLQRLTSDQLYGNSCSEDLESLSNTLSTLSEKKADLEKSWNEQKEAVMRICDLHGQLNGQSANDNVEDNVNDSGYIQQQLVEERKQLHSQQGEKPLVYDAVSANTVAHVVSEWTGIPAGQLLCAEIQQLIDLDNLLKARVIGQDCAIQDICDSIRIGRAGLADARKPTGVFLLCGPSGVGKTETAIALADTLYGGERNMITINMTEFKEEHKVSMLLGAPAGYVGYGEGGVLTEAVRRSPYSILLLDEFEKSHPSVHDIFYQIFDKGRIKDSEGREIDFRQTIIIMTSNAADTTICDLYHQVIHKGQPPVAKAMLPAINDELLQFFKPAFLGRLTIIPYFPLNQDSRERICQLALKRMEVNLQSEYSAELHIDNNVAAFLAQNNDNPTIGARAIEHTISQKLLPTLSRQCLERIAAGEQINSVKLSLADDNFTFSIE